MPFLLPIPPQIVSVPPSPPAPPVVVTRPQGAIVPERSTIDVEVRAGGELLWSGPMTVTTRSGATFTRRLSEPAPDTCPTPGYDTQTEASLSIQLNPQRTIDAAATLGVQVRWGRTLPGTCPFRTSARTVELNEGVALAPGQGVTLAGDGGLVVRLRRR